MPEKSSWPDIFWADNIEGDVLGIVTVYMNAYGAIFLLVGCWLFVPSLALAYIDPGTGSQLLQILVAALLGGLFTIKMWWTSFRHFISRIFSRKNSNQDKDTK